MIEIRQIGEDNWQALRDIRLKALQSDPSVFGSNYAKEKDKTEAEWRAWLSAEDIGVYLVFDQGTPVGMTGITIDKADPSKTTAILWGSWLEKSYRGTGLSLLLYNARLDWAKNHPTCTRILTSHRASNIASKNANQKHGFIFTHAAPKTWHDGRTEDEHMYELKIPKPLP